MRRKLEYASGDCARCVDTFLINEVWSDAEELCPDCGDPLALSAITEDQYGIWLGEGYYEL